MDHRSSDKKFNLKQNKFDVFHNPLSLSISYNKDACKYSQNTQLAKLEIPVPFL